MPVKQKCIPADTVSWWGDCSQGADSNTTAIPLPPCLLFQWHRHQSRSVACPTSSPKSRDALLPDSHPWGHANSHHKNTESGPLKKKCTQAYALSIPIMQQEQIRNLSVHCSHSAQEKCQFMGMADALPAASKSGFAPWKHRSWGQQYWVPGGSYAHACMYSTVLPHIACTAPQNHILHPVVVLKQTWGTVHL